jgi:hypothetical protein
MGTNRVKPVCIKKPGRSSSHVHDDNLIFVSEANKVLLKQCKERERRRRKKKDEKKGRTVRDLSPSAFWYHFH